MKKTIYILMCAVMALAIVSCDKVSGTGILIGSSGVNDRVIESSFIFQKQYDDRIDIQLEDNQFGYSFLIGADSHVSTDSCRIDEMFEDAYNNVDLLVAHLGDLADTQPEPYDLTYRTMTYWYGVEMENMDHIIPFYPVVGNHDITHNGFAYFQSFMATTTYVLNVCDSRSGKRDVFVFMDTASGTHGEKQMDLIDDLIAEDNEKYGDNIRNMFFFGHTNYFRGTTGNVQFCSTFPREELYSMLKYFHDWQEEISGKVIVFSGHIHEYGYYNYAGVDFYNLDAMSERNNPEPGYYLERVNIGPDGVPEPTRVKMYYTTKKYHGFSF